MARSDVAQHDPGVGTARGEDALVGGALDHERDEQLAHRRQDRQRDGDPDAATDLRRQLDAALEGLPGGAALARLDAGVVDRRGGTHAHRSAPTVARSFVGGDRSALGGLPRVCRDEPLVPVAAAEQLVVGAVVDDPPLLEVDDVVGEGDGGHPVGDDEHGRPAAGLRGARRGSAARRPGRPPRSRRRGRAAVARGSPRGPGRHAGAGRRRGWCRARRPGCRGRRAAARRTRGPGRPAGRPRPRRRCARCRG